MNKRHWPAAILGFGLVTAFIAACGSATSPTPPPQAKADPSFATDIQPIFNAGCAAASCHGGSAQAGLVLTSGQAYANIVNVASTQDPAKFRVLPSDATNSYIVIKLEGRQTVGTRMPQGSTLNAVSIQNIKNWINRGASNN
jgi:hypothetical protein